MPLHTFTVASAVADYYADSGVEFSVLVVAAATTPDAPIRCLREVVSGKHDAAVDAGGTVLHAVVDAVRDRAQLEVERIATVVIPDASNTLNGLAFVVRVRLDGTSQVDSAHWASLEELSTDAPGSVWLSHPQSISVLYSNEGVVFKNADDAFPIASDCRIVRMPDGPMDEANIAKCFTLMDEAVEWLVYVGRADQWGDVPWSKSERLSKFLRETCARDDLFGWFIEDAKTGACLGALIGGSAAPDYASMFPVNEPQVYIEVLVTSSRRRGQNLGATLVGVAKAHAQDRGISLVRVDCYNGGDGQLTRWYEKTGFSKVGVFEMPGWKGCVLEQRVY